MAVKAHRVKQTSQAASERLLNVLAEQMKSPLLQIARRAELAQLANGSRTALEQIELTAESAIRLLDSYLLSTKLAQAQSYLQLEPVSISGVMSDSAHHLAKLAQQYNCELQLHLSGKYEPIMAHRAGLEAALTSLGYVFIESQGAAEHKGRPIVKLAAHRSRSGIVTGMFTDADDLSANVFQRARLLHGRARQPLSNLTAGSGAGVFVADTLLACMSARLRIAHHQKLTGLAATFLPSHQMSMV